MIRENKEPMDKNGDRHGYWETYYTNGQLDFKAYYIHGRFWGYFENYYSNGHLCSKGHYIRGIHYGYWEGYKPNGELYFKRYYYMGNLLHQTSNNEILL